MFLAIRDGVVVERSNDIRTLLTLDETLHEVIEWNKPLSVCRPELGERRLDPRSKQEKDADVEIRYLRNRQREYPSVVKQLDMMYWDAVNGTTTWVDEITRIKERHPKPEVR